MELTGGEQSRRAALATRLLDSAPLLIMVVDASGDVRSIDGAVRELTGYEPDELIGESIIDHLDLGWNPRALDSIGYAMANPGLRRPMLFRVRRKDGSSFVAEVTANSQLDDPVIGGLAVYVRRWDERHLLDQVIESLASTAPLTTTLELLTQVMGAETLEADGLVMLDPVYGRFTRVVAVTPLPSPLSTDMGTKGTPWRRTLQTGAPVWTSVDELSEPTRSAATQAGYRSCWCWPVVREGDVDACLTLWRRLPDEPDHTCRLLLETLVRVTGLVVAQHRAAQLLRHAANHDPLTGLANRARFMQRLEDALSGESHGPLVGVLYVDLDNFKPVNDRLGHGAGDEVLREVARRLRAVVREGDLVARLGGDEFTVVCPGVTDRSVLQSVAERLTGAVRGPIAIGDEQVHISASVGLAFAPPGRCSIDVLLDAADAALYDAKETERGTWKVADLPVA
jgi:diguanylate cyclase (GGDEF)-like protein/PAS domain S-box-containing protein